jgi:uncharacterized membrane protein
MWRSRSGRTRNGSRLAWASGPGATRRGVGETAFYNHFVASIRGTDSRVDLQVGCV